MKKLITFVTFTAPLYAMAALPSEVTDTLDTVKEDILKVGGLIIALSAVAMGIRWVKAMFF